MRATFRKEERLCSKKLLDRLFSEGKSFNQFPFRIMYLTAPLDGPYPVQVTIAVPKRKIRNAVQRNQIKRWMREAYRKNKDIVYSPLSENGHQMALMLIYIGSPRTNYTQVEDKIIVSLQRLIREYEQGNQ